MDGHKDTCESRIGTDRSNDKHNETEALNWRNLQFNDRLVVSHSSSILTMESLTLKAIIFLDETSCTQSYAQAIRSKVCHLSGRQADLALDISTNYTHKFYTIESIYLTLTQTSFIFM
jgi:hypothetical protein